METWNVVPTDDGYCLTNSSRTKLSVSKRLKKFDVLVVLTSLEERGVPFGFSRGIDEIKFTLLRGSLDGYYDKCKVWISCGVSTEGIIDKVIIHEIAHHLDDIECMSIDPEMKREKKLKAKYVCAYAKKSVSEYVSMGFEMYYCGTEKEKRSLKRHNRYLYETIKRIDRKYRTK